MGSNMWKLWTGVAIASYTTDMTIAMKDHRRKVLKPSQLAEFDEWVVTLPAMTRQELIAETEKFVWLSAYAANNPTSVYHDMCDATYDEWVRRDDVGGYRAGWRLAAGE